MLTHGFSPGRQPARLSAEDAHRTRMEFTARFERSPGSALYIRITVTFRGAGGIRRWQSAVAVAAAFSLFVALVAGSALRPKFAAAELPEPAAWSQGTTDAGAHAALMHLHGCSSAMSYPALAASRDSAPTNKTNEKPFHSTWMTKDRPSTWSRLSPQSVLSPVPIAFIPLGFQPERAQPRAPAAVRADRDILTQLCVARR